MIANNYVRIMVLCLPFNDYFFPESIAEIQCYIFLTRTLFHIQGNAIIYFQQLCWHLLSFRTVQSLLTILKLYLTSNVSFLLFVWGGVWYKSWMIKVADIYVSILVPLFILSYTCWYIKNIQSSILPHPMKKKLFVLKIDS